MAHSVDHHHRSLVKAITWRVLGIVMLGGLSWLFTGDFKETGLITITFNAIRFVLYYVHERVWERTEWGRKKAVEEDYAI